MSTETRPQRITKLLELRNRVDEEIAAIEAEMREEMAATRRAKESARQANVRLRNRPVAQCGTESGYARHRRVTKDPACDACKLAHRVYEAQRVARKVASDLRVYGTIRDEPDRSVSALQPGSDRPTRHNEQRG